MGLWYGLCSLQRVKVWQMVPSIQSGIALVKSPSLTETVYQALRDAILNGVYAPGTMLRQEEVSVALGVSRNPLREVLPRLETEGLVVLHPRRGYQVVSLNEEEIYDVFALRILLESDLVQRAVNRKKTIDERRIRDILDEMAILAERPETADLPRWFALNLRFHDALMLPAGCAHHMRALFVSRGALETYIRAEVRLTGDLIAAQDEHTQLANAFFNDDGAGLVQLTHKHSEHTRDRLLLGLRSSAVLPQ